MENQINLSRLSSDDEQALKLFVNQNQPCTISVHNDPYKFCKAMTTRQNDEHGQIVFGQAQFAKSLMRNCYVGILENTTTPAAAAIYHNGQFVLHIYQP